MPERTLNPYAPTLAGSPQGGSLGRSGTGYVAVLTMTLLGVVCSGAVCGALLICVSFVALVVSGDGSSESAFVLMFTPVAAMVGALVAGIAAVVAIPTACVLLRRPLAVGGLTPQNVRRLAAVSGLLAGVFSFSYLSGPSLYGIVFSLLPGVIGGLVTGIFVNVTLLRSANSRWSTTRPLPTSTKTNGVSDPARDGSDGPGGTLST